MKVLIVGLGIQGRKRLSVADKDVVATVDPFSPDATYRSIEEVPLNSFDAALLCIPDAPKIEIITY
jgi:scyllo-inositol 2-dehydrogenase (NADP+)